MRTFILLLAIVPFFLNCQGYQHLTKRAQIRDQVKKDLISVVYKHDVLDLTHKILMEAKREVDDYKILAAVNDFLPYGAKQMAEYKITVGPTLAPKLRAFFSHMRFYTFEKELRMELGKEENVVKIESPLYVYKLFIGNNNEQHLVVSNAVNHNGDFVKAEAMVLKALDPDQYHQLMSKVLKSYPEFDWNKAYLVLGNVHGTL